VIKQLKDYPLNEWMEAADGCDYCGAKYEVMVTWVDETGKFGDVTYRIKHEDGCPDRYDDFTGEPIGDTVENVDAAGWTFSERIIPIAGRRWVALKSLANIGPCLNCWKLVVGIPLILWPSNAKVELDFCFNCAAELSILDQLKERSS